MDNTLTIHEGDPQYGKQPLKVWGPFQILEQVGAGGFGEVYRAFDTVLQREVALKVLLPRVSSQADQHKEILREARLLAKVRHPNVVSVYGVDTHDGRVGFWSDFVRGHTLTQLLAMQGPFGPREAALVGIDLCKAVSAVHTAGLLHRDIKASNAMREEGGRILLMDFGLSLEEQVHHHLGGTPTYMAPELFTGGQASVASDIYALGVLLYHLLTTKYPVDAPTLPEFTAQHETNKRRSLYDDRADLPEKLVQAIETATRKNPAERFQSAGQMLSALSDSLGSGSTQTMVSANAVPGGKRFHWWMAVPALGILGAALWFPVRGLLPKGSAAASAGGSDAAYFTAQSYLDKYYIPGNLDKAIAGFQKVVTADPRYAVAFAGLCRAYFINYRDLGSPELVDKIQAACSSSLSIDPELASVHVTRGMLYTLLTKNDLAEQEIKAALSIDKKNAEAIAARAELFIRQGRNAEVEPEYQKAEDFGPRDWRWPNQLGNFFLTNGRFEEAANQFKLAVSLTPDNSKVWNNLGIAYRRLGNSAEAKKAYYKAIDLYPADNYFANLGNVLQQEGSYREAVDLYLKAVKLNPSNYLTVANLAYVYDRTGDKVLARENYMKAIALAEEDRARQPQDATVLSRLGSYYATIGLGDKSLPLLRQAAALDPDNPTVLYRAGEGYELLHHRDDALRWIGKALEKKYPLEQLKRNPEMAALIADRRFAAIEAKSK